jgi:hypothetical protein
MASDWVVGPFEFHSECPAYDRCAKNNGLLPFLVSVVKPVQKKSFDQQEQR